MPDFRNTTGSASEYFSGQQGSDNSYDSVTDIQAVYRDPRFRADLREYYASKGTGYYDSDEDLIERFFSDGNWRDLNTVGAVQALSETATQNDRLKTVTARLQQVWDRQPAFFQEGGRGLAAVPDIAKALVLDPVNLLGGGGGLVQGGKAARVAYAAGKGVGEAVNAGMRAGAVRGALIEGGINAGQEAIVDTALQQRNVDLGLQDEVSQTQTALGAGAGALIGGGVGGVLGGLAGRGAGRQAATQAEDLVSRGLTRRDIGTMTPDQLNELSALPTTRPYTEIDPRNGYPIRQASMPNDISEMSPDRAAQLAEQRAQQQAAAQAAQTATADDLEVKYAGHLAAVDRAIEEHRSILDDYNSSGFDKLADGDPNKAVYQEQLANMAEVIALRDTLAKLRAEEEQIRALQGSNALGDDSTAMQRRMLFEQRFSKFRNALEQYSDRDQINADILASAEQIRARRNAELDAQAAKDAPKPAKAKVDPQGQKAAAQQQAAPAPAPAAPAAQAAAPAAPAPAAPAPAQAEAPAPAAAAAQAEPAPAVETPTATTDRYAEAVNLVLNDGKPSSSFIGRKLGIEGAEAFKYIQRMEQEGIVSAPDATGKRTLLKTKPAAATTAGDAAAAPPPPAPGAAAAPNTADFVVTPEGTATKATPAAEPPPARPAGVTISDDARARMAELEVDEADLIDWYNNGAPGWANKEKVKGPHAITKGAPGAYKRAVRDGQWVGNAKPKTPDEQPNRLNALLSADDPYSVNFRAELEELVSETARFSEGLDAKSFRDIFEALSTDEKYKSNRADFMMFLDEGYKANGIKADAVESIGASAQEGSEGIQAFMTNAMRKRLGEIGFSADEIRNMKPEIAARRIKEADNRDALIAKGWTKSQVEEMTPSQIRDLLEEKPTSTTSIPNPKVYDPGKAFKLTPEDRAKLNEIGYADETIDRMSPDVLQKLLSGKIEARRKKTAREIEAEATARNDAADADFDRRNNFDTLVKAYQSQGMSPEEAVAKAKETIANTSKVDEAPLPRSATGESINKGKFQNQRDRQTTQTAIRREGIFETAGRNWNNNRIADMLKMGIATKRIPTSEEYWQTRGNTFVSESINTSGLSRGEDKFLNARNFTLTEARIASAETIKANQNATQLSKTYGEWLSRFNDRVAELLVTPSVTEAPNFLSRDPRLPTELRDITRTLEKRGLSREEAQSVAREYLIRKNTPKGELPVDLAREADKAREEIRKITDRALEYAMTADKPNTNGMAEILGIELAPEVKGQKDDYRNAVKQILTAAKRASKAKKQAAAAGGETAVKYVVDYPHPVIKNGERVTAPTGSEAWYDAYSMRSFASLEEAIAHRNGVVPTTEADKRSYLAQFMASFKSTGNLKALRENLEKMAAGDFSFVKKTPSGLVDVSGQKLYLMLAKKDGDRRFPPRKVSRAQYDAGGDALQKILGDSDISEFDVRYTTDDTVVKSVKGMWKLWDEAVPVTKLEEVANVYGNRTSLNPVSYENYMKKMVSSISDDEADAIYAASQISLGKVKLPYESAEAVKAAAKAGKLPMHIVEMAENALAYFAPISSNREGMLGIAKQMAALNRIREREAPMGFVLPSVKRAESIEQLRGIFSGYDSNVVMQMETMLRRLGGSRGNSPIFKQLADAALSAREPTIGHYTWSEGVGTAAITAMPKNTISMASGTQIASQNRLRQLAGGTKFKDFVGGKSHPVATLSHELFHWAWRNILNPADRIEFVEALARQLYDKDGNPLAIADQLPPLANALQSINEVGANLFSQWFLRNRSDRMVMGQPDVTPKTSLDKSRLDKWLSGLDEVFTKFKDHILGVIDRYFHNIPLDPALEAKFAKILPDDKMMAFRDGRGPPPDTFGPKAKYASKIDQRYQEFRLIKRDLEEALTSNNPESVLRAAIAVSNYIRSIAVNRQPKTAATGIFSPIFPWYKILHERNKELTFAITGRKIGDEAVEDLNKILTKEGKSKAAKDIDDADVGDYSPLGKEDPDYIDADEVISKAKRVRDDKSPTMEQRVDAMDVMSMRNAMEAIREMYFEGNPIFRPGTAPNEKYSLKFALEQVARSFEQKHIELFNTLPKGSAPNILGEVEELAGKSANTRVERTEKIADAQFGNVMAEILDAKNFDYKSAGEVDPSTLGNIRDQSIAQMAREWPRVKGTTRGIAIMAEVKRRLKAEPFLSGPIKVPKAMVAMKADELNDVLFTALRDGGPDNATVVSQAVNELHRRAANEINSRNKQPKIEAITADAREAVSRELEDNEGTPSQIGIPANARATVREALSYVTDRNPEHAYVARTMMYRLYNLMGKTVRATVEDSNLMSMADLARLAGVEPGAGATGMVVDFRSPAFKSLRRDLRRFAIGLNKQTSNPIDLMHEIGHVIIRGVLSDSDRASVLEFYRAAKNEIKDRVQNTYGSKYSGLSPAAREERLAHEWFAESWAQWAAERTVRGDILSVAENGRLSDLTVRGTIDGLIDKLTEMVAYVVNGLIGRDDVKQMFRRLTYYGDMFEVRKPSSVADVYGDNYAIPAHMAADYVDESLFRNKARLEKMQDFVRGTEGEDANGNPVIFYHGSPVGYALRKAENPDVVLRPSSTGKYGPGTYTTFNPSAASNYAGGTPRSINAMIEAADLPDDVADDMLELAMDLEVVRRQIRANIGELTVVRFEADKMADQADGDVNAFLVRDDVNRIEKTLAAFYRREKSILDTLQRNGISPDGVVLPLVTNAKRLANFSEKMRYEPDDPFVMAVVDKVQSFFPQGTVDSDNAYGTFTSLGSVLTGRKLYDRLITMTTKYGVSQPQAKIMVQNALRELGFDGMRATFSDKVVTEGVANELVHEGAVIFETAKLKHVDADEFDPADDRLYLRALTDVPVAPMGRIIGSIIEHDADGFNPGIIAGAMESAEAAGVAPQVSDTMRSMAAGRNLTTGEFQTKANVMTVLLGSQSKRMKQDGLVALGNRYENFFPAVNVEFGKHFYPLVVDVLRKLPGADSEAGRWMKRTFGIVPGVGKRLGKQPVAYNKIVSALRHGQGTEQWNALSAAERNAAQSVRDVFTNLRALLKKSGDSIGFRENYFPQIHNGEAIAANREQYINAWVKYLRTSDMANGIERTDEARREIGERVAMKITDEDADQYFPPQIRSSNTKSDNLDYSRLLELEKYPGHIKDFEPFLENDLEAIITKYIDGASRRLVQNNMFGNGTHMFNDYILASTEGVDGIAELLTTRKVYRKEFRALEGGEMRNAVFELEVGMPFQGRGDLAKQFADGLVKTFQTAGRAGAHKALMDLVETPSITYARRAEAILDAIEDFGGKTGAVSVSGVEAAHQSMKILVGQPLTNPSMGGKTTHTIAKNLRAFNSVTYLSFATLTSLTDIVLPIIRSGEFGAWYRGVKQMAQDPEYRQLIRNVGVAVESEVHQHLANLYGTHSSKTANAFFNGIMLTPWTNIGRKITAATGFETMKVMQQKAFRNYKEGVPLNKQNNQYQTAHRFLKRYGMEDYLPEGVKKNIAIDQKLLAEDDNFKKAIVRFADEGMNTPNPSDLPLWTQTPLGGLVFQFKAYPLMMGRMARYVIDEARQGNVKPLVYLATIAPGFGAATLAIKDVVQMRGGEDRDKAEIRSRNLQKWLGYDKDVHGDANDFLGWYVEGILTAGGFGLIAEMLYNISSQVDNGAYGQNRILGAIGGPTVGTMGAAIDIAAGAQAAMGLSDSTSNAKERTAVREIVRRVPVVGGMGSVREGITDAVAGPRTERSTGGWNSDWKGWE